MKIIPVETVLVLRLRFWHWVVKWVRLGNITSLCDLSPSLPPQSPNCQSWDQQLLRGGSWWSLGLDLAPPPAQLSPAAVRRWLSCQLSESLITQTDWLRHHMWGPAGSHSCHDEPHNFSLLWWLRSSPYNAAAYTDWQKGLRISHSNLSRYQNMQFSLL